MLTQQDVVVDPALGNVSIKYGNDQFIADDVAPMMKVAKQTGKYYIYDKSNLRVDKSARAPGAPAAEVDAGFDPRGVFSADDHAFKIFIDDRVAEQADAALNPLVDETENLTEKLLLDREIDLATMLTDTAQVTQNVTLATTSQWSDYLNSDPIGDIRTGRTTVHQNSFKKVNTLVLGKPAFDILCDHPQIIERVKYSQLGVVTEELLARLFNVDKVLVGEAGYNSAKEGQTAVLGYVWGKNAILAYVSPQVRLKMLTFAATITYQQRIVKRWREEDREGTYIRVGNDNYQHVLIAVTCGYLVKNAVA